MRGASHIMQIIYVGKILTLVEDRNRSFNIQHGSYLMVKGHDSGGSSTMALLGSVWWGSCGVKYPASKLSSSYLKNA